MGLGTNTNKMAGELGEVKVTEKSLAKSMTYGVDFKNRNILDDNCSTLWDTTNSLNFNSPKTYCTRGNIVLIGFKAK